MEQIVSMVLLIITGIIVSYPFFYVIKNLEGKK